MGRGRKRMEKSERMLSEPEETPIWLLLKQWPGMVGSHCLARGLHFEEVSCLL